MIEAPHPKMHATMGQVLVADDHILVRTGIKLLISNILGPVDFVDGEDLDAARATLLGAGATELSPRHARARGVRARGHRRQPDRAARRASPKFE